MIALDLFDFDSMSDLDIEVAEYVNKNVCCIIKVLIDYLEDENDFTSEDFLPYNNLRIDDMVWREYVYDVYDIIRSDVMRERIQPIYERICFIRNIRVVGNWLRGCNGAYSNKINKGIRTKN